MCKKKFRSTACGLRCCEESARAKRMDPEPVANQPETAEPTTHRAKKVKKNPIQGITRPAICRVARRAGVKQVSQKVYEETRASLAKFLAKIIEDASILAEHGHRKTVTAADVEAALHRNGRTLYGARIS